MTNLKQQALRELAIRELEKRYKPQRESLVEYLKMQLEQGQKKEFVDNWHITLIAEKLKLVLEHKIKRLIINIPPRHFKTEIITKGFPTFALGNNPKLEFIVTGYSTDLTQTFSGQARDYYNSDVYKLIFPRSPKLREDQNTKEWWVNVDGGGYYATGTGGSITGRGANCFIIDDPIKPDEANKSEIARVNINQWYDNTVLSRLNNPAEDAVIIVMQRTHENDLCGYLIEKSKTGGEIWEVLTIPSIAESDEVYRLRGEALMPQKIPIEALLSIRSNDVVMFECQYQQNPTSKLSQEFHQEFFRYIPRDKVPKGGRMYTVIDPAFSKKEGACETAVITFYLLHDVIYIVDVSHDKYSATELEDEAIIHVRKWNPLKLGIEAYGAQVGIGPSLKNRLRVNHLTSTSVEEIRQVGDKDFKIRKLLPLYRNGNIYHVTDSDVNGNQTKSEGILSLESQLTKFPRGKLVDIIDALQMAFDLIELNPTNLLHPQRPRFEFDSLGRPKLI